MVSGERKYKPETVRAAFAPWFSGEESAQGEQRAFCPVCEDPATSNSPSAMFNAEEGIWNCVAGKGNHGGSIRKLVLDMKRETGWDIRSAAMKHRNSDPAFAAKRDKGLTAANRKAAPLPTEERVEEWNASLLSTTALLSDLMNERGFTRKTIIDAKIGYYDRRYTIPVYDDDGELVNIRRYFLKAPRNQDKMLNIAGHGEARIYGLEDLKDHDIIVVTEGETDRLLLKQEMEHAGEDIGVVTHTAGAGTFRPQWGRLFAGKTVYVCYDNDEGGRKGMEKAANIIKPYAAAVYKIKIPVERKGADITDFLHLEGHSVADFLGLMEEAQSSASESRFEEPVATGGKKMSLVESMSEENQAVITELTVSVAGKQAEPYTAPKKLTATCSQDKGMACTNCPVNFSNGQMSKDIRIDDEELFRFVDAGEDRRKKLYREITGARCSDRVQFDIDESYHIEELLVQPSVDDRRDDETQQPVKRTVFSVGTYKSGVNEKVRVVGRNVTDPKTGKLRFMSWNNSPVDVDIDKFSLTPDIREALSKFQPGEDQRPLDKCLEIAGDNARNVTYIYGRDILHVAYDLVFHSVLGFNVFGKPVDKGWLEMLVVGDTRTGKSEVAKHLIQHYRAGEHLSCEGVTFAGIVGGVQQIDGRWHMTWGTVPMNDRRLVVLDEVSGMKDTNVIEQMSSIRSSGIAQITKISSEQTSARTRLIWISNPADGSSLNSNPDVGMTAMKSVVPNAEDQARFDFVCAAGRGEVDDKLINSGFAPLDAPTYSSEISEQLVKWAWSLTRDQVVVSRAAANAASKEASKLGKSYIADPPLIQSENVRYKLLRIAAAMAARTFSIDDEGNLKVERVHVLDAVRFLDMVYSSEFMGYKRKSFRTTLANERAEKRRTAVKNYMLENESLLFALQAIGGDTFRNIDLKNYGGMDDSESQQAVKALVQHNMVARKSRGEMKMEPVLLSILREIEDQEEEDRIE